MSQDQKAAFHKNGMDGIRNAAKVGSKLENFLAENLTSAGFTSIMHIEQSLMNENLHLDIFIPSQKVVIEVDGPFHHKKVWDDRVLQSKQKSDQQKDLLCLKMGFSMIRVKTTKRFSPYQGKVILDRIIALIGELQNKKSTDTVQVYHLSD